MKKSSPRTSKPATKAELFDHLCGVQQALAGINYKNVSTIHFALGAIGFHVGEARSPGFHARQDAAAIAAKAAQ